MRFFFKKNFFAIAYVERTCRDRAKVGSHLQFAAHNFSLCTLRSYLPAREFNARISRCQPTVSLFPFPYIHFLALNPLQRAENHRGQKSTVLRRRTGPPPHPSPLLVPARGVAPDYLFPILSLSIWRLDMRENIGRSPSKNGPTINSPNRDKGIRQDDIRGARPLLLLPPPSPSLAQFAPPFKHFSKEASTSSHHIILSTFSISVHRTPNLFPPSLSAPCVFIQYEQLALSLPPLSFGETLTLPPHPLLPFPTSTSPPCGQKHVRPE